MSGTARSGRGDVRPQVRERGGERGGEGGGRGRQVLVCNGLSLRGQSGSRVIG